MRRHILIALAIGIPLLMTAGPRPAEARKRPALSYFERLKLANWKQITKVDKSSKYWRPTGMLLIAAKPTEVMGTFMDLKSVDGWMPKVKKCRVVRRKGKHRIWAVVILEFPWPVANAWVAVKYVWSRVGRGYSLKWDRHRGSMKKYVGDLQLYPWGKHWTLAISSMQAVPDIHVSRKRLNKGIVWGTEQLLHHLRAEVDRRNRRSALKAFKP